MRTCFSVRGLSAFPLMLAVLTAFACNGSPTQPDSAFDSPSGSAPRSFDAPSSFAQPSQLAEEHDDLSDASELTDAEDVEEIDASDLESSELDASDRDVSSLAATTPTAAATARKVAVSGVIRDKNTKRALAGVMVKVTGLQPVTSNSRGRYLINVSRGRRTFKFSKKNYTTFSDTETVTGALKLDVLMTPASAALSSITLSDNDVTVGTVVNGTVKLNKAAPSGGAKVLLSSTSPTIAAVVSSSVTIAGGKTTGVFKVNAKASGTTVIKAKYNNASKTANLKVRGGPPPPPPPTPPTGIVARFEYRPAQCEVVENPSGNPALLATCTFDASDSSAPAGATYTWTFPGSNVFTRNSPTLSNFGLTCGSLPNGIFERTVTLRVSSGGESDTHSAPVTFTKAGLC